MRLRYLLRERDTRDRGDEQVLSIYRDLGVVPKDERTDNFNKTPEDVSNYKLVMPGDVVVNKMKAWQGSIAVSPHRGIVSGDYLVCQVVREVDRRYLHHALRSQPMVAEYRVRSKGIRPSQWRLYWDDLAEIELRLPVLQRQQGIAAYLDVETARLDALIEKKEEMVALLEYRQRRHLSERLGLAVAPGSPARPSGDWPARRLGWIARIQGGITLGKKYSQSTEPYPYLRVANVQDGHIDLDDLAEVDVPPADASRHLLQAGDVLVLEGNGNPLNLGRGAIWDGEVEPCLHQNHVHSVRPNPKELLPEYLAAALRSEWVRHCFTSGANQVSIATLSQSALRDLVMPLPGLEEQRRLVEAVAQVAAECDRLRSVLKRQVRLLAEHRHALITAAVTGELEVPGMAA